MPLYLAAAVALVEEHQENQQETEFEEKATTPRRRKILRQVWVREWLTRRQKSSVCHVPVGQIDGDLQETHYTIFPSGAKVKHIMKNFRHFRRRANPNANA
ncbi:hypothetical protein PoB_001242100 [Plakobranchus ocellatus]|uniref:Secreted protein n=1 Tax=Plakobranchus ocellatus TaxID=259542 RepID=A0AAV3YU83_9GAST|nr:hypothetical protein PoB_001242100 [Plakobranchus ocellatus]